MVKPIAVIPARGGSKRIPRKNVKLFWGKPIICYVIEELLSSDLFENVIVSTDDKEIAETALRAGADIPFFREPQLADDHTPTVPVIADSLNQMSASGIVLPTWCCCVYPCTPLLLAEDLTKTLAKVMNSDADYCFPVVEYGHPIQRAMRFGQSKMEFIFPKNELTRTQDLENTFHDAGQFYWGRVSAWTDGINMHSNGIGYQIPSWRTVDIDTPSDWTRAEKIAKVVLPNRFGAP